MLCLEFEKYYDVDVYSVMHLSVIAWNYASQKIIANLFLHAGFKRKEAIKETRSNIDVMSNELLKQDFQKRNP